MLKHKTKLISGPSLREKKLSMVAHTVIPAAQEAEVEGS